MQKKKKRSIFFYFRFTWFNIENVFDWGSPVSNLSILDQLWNWRGFVESLQTLTAWYIRVQMLF